MSARRTAPEAQQVAEGQTGPYTKTVTERQSGPDTETVAERQSGPDTETVTERQSGPDTETVANAMDRRPAHWNPQQSVGPWLQTADGLPVGGDLQQGHNRQQQHGSEPRHGAQLCRIPREARRDRQCTSSDPLRRALPLYPCIS
ncbi:hypothetical protein FJT64_007025 [Amphibalanus amphitrite]|uniref:Uncharacterized protein n=1 Tax=Amphibalanus amphitrite TaxID=1232801 RepID=A0A6A4VVP0_AMPAM|nr:hypothetical protein FJT64_007025 [Amphibalanus amphitrite]